MLRSLPRLAPALRAPASARSLAIRATVATAPDTSGQTFPAPSHVSVAAEAADVARQLRGFYSDPESIVALDKGDRARVLADLVKRAAAIPETQVSEDWVVKNMKDKIPAQVKIGDNPYFKQK